MNARKNAITPSRQEDFSKWYQVVLAPLAEHGDVAGTQVIKPYGYAIWEMMQSYLDEEIKRTGHQNFYAPLLMSLDALNQEATHMDFAKECAVVTHSRLGLNEDQQLEPQRPLTKPVVIRPTSEAIIGPIVKNWIQSHRDLPLKLNQWANVVRWEMRTRLFLRSSEFLWQEGHTFHADKLEAQTHAKTMLGVYEDFFKNRLAFSPSIGQKPAYERFAGAEETHTLELMMQDGKALQGGTSHHLGQNFAKAYDITYTNPQESRSHVFGTSWGLTTRLIGALIMSHGDDDGLRLPPAVAPYQVVIIPVNAHQSDQVMQMCQSLQGSLSECHYANRPLRAHIDTRDMRGGEKKWDWVRKGVPIRIEIGPKDVDKKQMMVMLRSESVTEKHSVPFGDIEALLKMLNQVNADLLAANQQMVDEQSKHCQTLSEALDILNKKQCFVWLPLLDGEGAEKQLKPLGLSMRCLQACAPIQCGFSGKQTETLALIAKAY